MTIAELLKCRRPLILDGALGAELERRGLPCPPPLWSAAALDSHVDVVRAIHADYAAAGADILVANTFRTNPRTLRAAGLFERGPELNRRAIELARNPRSRRLDAGSAESVEGDSAADRNSPSLAEGRIDLPLIAASVAPVEDCYRPELVPDEETLLAEHRLMVAWLRPAVPDLVWIETIGTIREARAALRAAREANLPASVSFALREDGALLGGESLEEAVATIEPFEPELLGLNCIPPEGISTNLPRLRRLTSRPLVVYAHINNAAPTTGWSYAGRATPLEYADYARRWIAMGADAVGGCCGTTPEHIRALKRTLSSRRRGYRSRHPAWSRTTWGRGILICAGLALIALGFLLGFIPFLPGFPLGIAGIMLLSFSSRRVRRWLRHATRYLPEKMRDRLHFLHRAD